MPRIRKGTWKQSGDHFLIYVTLPQSAIPGRKDRRLPGIEIPAIENGRRITEANLDAIAKVFNDKPELALASLAKKGKLPDWVPLALLPHDVLLSSAMLNPMAAAAAGSLLESTACYTARFIKWWDKQGRGTVDHYDQVLRNHILPVEVEPGLTLGEKPIASITRNDVKLVAKALREKVLDKKCAPGSAYRNWHVFRTLVRTASDENGDPELYVRDDNPALGIKGPPAPGKQTRACLYPAEFLQLVTSEAVPLIARRTITVALYLMLRLGELATLRCEDIDLEHERITIRRGWDRRRRREKQPKDTDPRSFDVHPHLMPLLRQMIKEANGEGRVIPINPYNVASEFATYLDRVGLKRYELRHKSISHVSLTMHGLRATGATWAAREGMSPLMLRRILGHEKQDTTDRYFDDAQLLGRNIGDPFPVLPDCLLSANRSGNCSGGPQGGGIIEDRTGRRPGPRTSVPLDWY